VLEVMDHDLFDTRQIALDQAMTNIVPGADFLLLYGKSGQKDVYRYLWETGELIQYRLQNPATGLRLAPGGEFAVAMTRAEGTGATGVEGFYDGQPGMEILDLRGTSHAAVPYTLEGEGVGLAFTEAGGGLWSVVLQQGVEYLWRGELATGAADTIALAAPPLGIGTMPDGPFYVTHDDGFGLITFYDPATDTTEVAAGFALQGLLEDTPASETNQ